MASPATRRESKHATVDTTALGQCVQDLPPELFNSIMQLTLFPEFTTPSLEILKSSPPQLSTTITVDEAWRLPAVLQVNKASRRASAREYYGNNIFVFDVFNMKDCGEWLEMLSPAHRKYTTGLRVYDIDVCEQVAPLDCSRLWDGLRANVADSALLHILDASTHDHSALDVRHSEWMEIYDFISKCELSGPEHDAAFAFLKRLEHVLHTTLFFTTGVDKPVQYTWLPVVAVDETEVLPGLKKEFERLTANDTIEVESAHTSR